MAVRIYNLLLRLYPQKFRDVYGESMAQNFVDLYRDTSTGGTRKMFFLFLSLLRDLVQSLPQEHIESWKNDQLVANAGQEKSRAIILLYGGLLFHLILFLGAVSPWVARYDGYTIDMRTGIPPCYMAVNRFFEIGWGAAYPLIIIGAWFFVFTIKRWRLLVNAQLDSWTATKDALVVFPTSLFLVWMVGQIVYSIC
jgi:hypothetical protein